MAKTKISEYDSTAANNTDIDSINIAEGMAPSNVNNAIRELMAHLKDGLGAGTPVFLDQTNNRLGVGTTSPSAPTEVVATSSGSSTDLLHLRNNATATNTGSTIKFVNSTSGDSNSGSSEITAIRTGTNTGDLTFSTSNSSAAMTEAMRISGGHFLVGKTSASGSTAGAELRSGGTVIATVDGDYPLYLNRLTSDGDIAQFRKDGTEVGSIASRSGATLSFIGNPSSGNGAGVAASTNMIIPSSETGAAQDDRIDLGSTSTRWQDLYLSGGVYLGGTTSVNYLDDYEYGSFTPTYGGGTTDPSGVTYDGTVGNEGVYVKVGRLVFIQINIRTDAISNVGSGDLRIEGLPFAAASLASQGGVGSLAVSQAKDFAGEVPSAAYITEGGTFVTLFYRTSADGNALSSSTSDLGTGSNDNLIRIGGTYYSTA